MTADDRKDYRSLGEILRDAREAQDKSIEDVSEITKISPKVLLALEADDLDQVADPVYARSFVRNLAEALGLESRWLLTKLEHASAAQKPPPVAEGEERRDDTTWHIEDVRIQKVTTPEPRSFPRLATGVIVGVLLAVAGFWLVQRNSGSPPVGGDASLPEAHQADLGPGPPLVATTGDDPATTTDPVAGEKPQPANSTGESQPQITKPVPQAQSSPPQVAKAPTSAPEKAANPPADESDDDPTADATAADPQPAAPSSGSTAPPEEEVVVTEKRAGLPSIVRPGDEAKPPMMKLVVTAVEKVDVVVAADGRGRRLRTLNVGESWTIEGHDHFSLEISDPQRVQVELDGIHRDPPTGLSGEWILYPNPSPR